MTHITDKSAGEAQLYCHDKCTRESLNMCHNHLKSYGTSCTRELLDIVRALNGMP